MNILGINCFAHDTAAALVVDGRLVSFVEEERLNRDKHTWAFPNMAIEWCLENAGVGIKDIDTVTFDYRPGLDYARFLAFDIVPRFPSSGGRFAKQTYIDAMLAAKVIQFRKRWGYRGPVRMIDHHLAHAAASFLSSGFDQSVAISIDRGGDYLSTAIYLCRGTDLTKMTHIRNPHSLGELYSAVTWWLGFQPTWDEGKVMALASFGRPDHVDDFRSMVHMGPNGRFKLDLSWFGWHVEGRPVSDKFVQKFGPRRNASEELRPVHEDVAFAVQTVTEETALHVTHAALRATGPARLGSSACLAGGVCLNSVMNTRVLLEGGFDSLYMHPAIGDAGNAVGGALYEWHRQTGKPRDWQMDHAMWGPFFSDSEIRRVLDAAKLHYRKVADPAAEAAELIADGKIVGWFQGPAEAGPRALGNRSILADPRPAHMKDTINREVKHREPFRPFAPSVLAEEGHEWFEDFHASPFMLLVLPVKPAKRELVPAITHVDGTGRLQTVSEESNTPFYRLIRAFRDKTGIPMVLNTSFNDRAEPIVCSPADALKTYFGTGIDALVIGSFVLEK